MLVYKNCVRINSTINGNKWRFSNHQIMTNFPALSKCVKYWYHQEFTFKESELSKFLWIPSCSQLAKYKTTSKHSLLENSFATSRGADITIKQIWFSIWLNYDIVMWLSAKSLSFLQWKLTAATSKGCY